MRSKGGRRVSSAGLSRSTLDGEARALLDTLLARCTFPPPGTSLAVAVSGGPDSLALLVLAAAAGCDVTAVHVDHGQRPDSHLDAKVVAEVAAALGARFESVAVDVAAGPNIEARLRTARLAALPAGAVTGHTADDQAETMVLNLMRGAGLNGLAAMESGRSRHPIVRLRRAETHRLCALLGLCPVDDPSNSDPSILRNRVRRDVLPLLDSVAGRDVAGVLSRQAEHLAQDAALLDAMAAGIDPTDAAALRDAPRALARRAVRRWIASSDPDGYVPSAAAVDRVLAVAAGACLACEVGGGRSVRRTAGRLRILWA